MFVLRKIWRTLFSCNTCFEIRPFALQPANRKIILFDYLVQRISPETSSKVQLQVVLHDESSHSFHFTNSKGRDIQMKERDSIKDLLAELIPKHRHKANKDLEEKNK